MPTLSKPTGILDANLLHVERFARKFVVTKGCWEWTAGKNQDGYGQFGISGAVRYAHRIMWELSGKPLNPTKVIDHLCRNRSCVNPAHLEEVTNYANLMRGHGHARRNKEKTHCINGHPLSGNNLAYQVGGRRCATCFERSQVKRRLKVKATKEAL